jgi:predicted Zn finger-like uncharacterized protein
MSGEKYTRCPGCSTVFRVTPAQLALRGGQVRCGQCKTVFNGVEHEVSLAVPNGAQQPLSEAALGPPTLTLRNAASLEAPIAPPPDLLPPHPQIRRRLLLRQRHPRPMRLRPIASLRPRPPRHARGRSRTWWPSFSCLC